METFVLDGVTPSQNVTDRIHWTTRRMLRDEWYWLVKASAGVREPRRELPIKLKITRVGKRLIDDGNLPAGCKYLIDALVEFGHAVDDSREWMRVTYDQRRCRSDEEPHMEVTVRAT